jgi:hypothetical protein
MGNELKPCPFCGGEAIAVHPDEYGSGGQHVPPYHASCDMTRGGCGVSVIGETEKEAAATWNRRALDPVGEPVLVGHFQHDDYNGWRQVQSQYANDHDLTPLYRLSASTLPQEPREAEGAMRAAFNAWVQDCGCDTDGAWSAWQGAWKLLRGAQEGKAGEDARDAARYRWLRNCGEYFEYDPLRPSPWAVIGNNHTDCHPCSREELDAAVDAAMSTTESADSRGEKG